MNGQQDQVFTGGYGKNDPYQYASDNGLGMLEGHAIKYITRHASGEPTGQKYGARDVKAAIATLTRLAIDRYGVGFAEIAGVVRTVYDGRRVPTGPQMNWREDWVPPKKVTALTQAEAMRAVSGVAEPVGVPVDSAALTEFHEGHGGGFKIAESGGAGVPVGTVVPNAGSPDAEPARYGVFEPLGRCYKPGQCRRAGLCTDSGYCLRIGGLSE